MTQQQRGSATVWVLVMIAVVATVMAAALALGAVLVARQRAAAAADEMALAVAGHSLAGGTAACLLGGRIARLDGAAVLSCSLTDAIATVRVRVALPGPLRRFGTASGSARAGPASAR
jgi:secretion/DNA translocation related TadE-like protein